jgi:hypothetical protein
MFGSRSSLAKPLDNCTPNNTVSAAKQAQGCTIVSALSSGLTPFCRFC